MHTTVLYCIHKYPQHVKQILICCSGFPSMRYHPKQVTTPQRSGIKARWRTIRKSVAAPKGEKKMTAGGLELIDQIDGGAKSGAEQGPPWECQLSRSQINLEGKINYALFLPLRALPLARGGFPNRDL